MTRVSLIAAVSEDGFIGRKGAIPWHVKGDMRFFKEKSVGKPNIMGRVTFESLPAPLPNRTNIVVTRQKDWHADGVVVCHDFAGALAHAQSLGADEVMVIGGEAVYAEAIDIADTLYLTTIHVEVPDGDARFPVFDKHDWHLDSEERHAAGPKDTTDYTVRVYTRKR